MVSVSAVMAIQRVSEGPEANIGDVSYVVMCAKERCRRPRSVDDDVASGGGVASTSKTDMGYLMVR